MVGGNAVLNASRSRDSIKNDWRKLVENNSTRQNKYSSAIVGAVYKNRQTCDGMD